MTMMMNLVFSEGRIDRKKQVRRFTKRSDEKRASRDNKQNWKPTVRTSSWLIGWSVREAKGWSEEIGESHFRLHFRCDQP